MTGPIKVGVIGAGFIGKQHVEAIRRIPGTEVVAIADVSENLLEFAEKQLYIPKTYKNYMQMLQEQDIDVIHNCTPTMMHFPINKDAIAFKKHIYSEKPFTLTLQESKELVELADAGKVAAAINFNYRHNVMVHEMRERVRNGSIGKVLMVYGEYLQDWLLYETDFDWRIDPKIGGESRAIADIGSHCFDTLEYILDKKITSVYAKLMIVHDVRKRMEKSGTFSSSKGKILEEVPVHSEDAAFIMVEFEDGTPGLVNISQVCAGKKNGLRVNISGSESSLEWNQERADRLLIGHRNIGNEDIYAGEQYLTDYARAYLALPNGHSVGWADALKNGIAAFYDSIRDESYANSKQIYATFNDGLEIMRIVKACLESNLRNRWVNVLDLC